MGAVQTSKVFPHSLFERPSPYQDKRTNIIINVSVPNSRNRDSEVAITFVADGTGINCLDTHIHKANNSKIYEWSPKSRQRDFEVIIPYKGNNEIHVAQGDMIGVVIVEAKGMYVKLAWIDNKIKPVICGPWDHSENGQNILNSDLTLGLDVLLLAGPVHNIGRYDLNETLDEEGPVKPCPILLQEFEHLQAKEID